jgi:hypothetical protein
LKSSDDALAPIAELVIVLLLVHVAEAPTPAVRKRQRIVDVGDGAGGHADAPVTL